MVQTPMVQVVMESDRQLTQNNDVQLTQNSDGVRYEEEPLLTNNSVVRTAGNTLSEPSVSVETTHKLGTNSLKIVAILLFIISIVILSNLVWIRVAIDNETDKVTMRDDSFSLKSENYHPTTKASKITPTLASKTSTPSPTTSPTPPSTTSSTTSPTPPSTTPSTTSSTPPVTPSHPTTGPSTTTTTTTFKVPTRIWHNPPIYNTKTLHNPSEIHDPPKNRPEIAHNPPIYNTETSHDPPKDGPETAHNPPI